MIHTFVLGIVFFLYDNGSITTLMTDIHSNDVNWSKDCLYTVVISPYISNIFTLMNVFEQQCIINLALEKTQDREKRIGLAKTKEFLVHSAWKKPMILVVSLWIPY